MSLKEKIIYVFQKLFWGVVTNRFTVEIYEWFLWNKLKNGKFPEHVAVILDGNRRWAQSRRMWPLNGHLEGAKKAENFVEWCWETGKIKTTTLFIFSTENFRRPRQEVEELMGLINDYLNRLARDDRIHENEVRVKVLGRREMLPPKIQESIGRLEKATEDYDRYYLNLAIAYGGRMEILDAVKRIALDVKEGVLSPSDLTEEIFEKNLYTHFLPNPHPDLIIRTSGEERLSNFLLWQGAYSELCFLDVYWPNFRKLDLYRAISVYQNRQRRFGS
ncbi:polyprenyl diphosphate synthase [Candidatus Hecatella orcuttiae]|jgi:tritrans,polycis-undecaprenyl-diphosphate synthase [geranylgeranyl-diphosphate specific]|uniref:polyprenyl diphosphate synthase n=1 Tax=Candidatus Hecatella orcuttiae TaxID=1935119 RepID=UPI0028680873|nr:polyprenyl diphosphate synthase [Candidatus Hecatella orcuttiae]